MANSTERLKTVERVMSIVVKLAQLAQFLADR